MPKGIGYEWTGQSFEERLSAKQAPLLYALSLIVVFLALAALYENWSIPVAVILVVPLGILGALLGATLRGLPNDVFFKVGLLTIVGLSAKNAILIIEFAKDLQAQGKGLIEATLEAAHLRLRPILMTSLAFILGVSPLALSTGAGSASRHDIGTGVAGGMITATVLAADFRAGVLRARPADFQIQQTNAHHDGAQTRRLRGRRGQQPFGKAMSKFDMTTRPQEPVTTRLNVCRGLVMRRWRGLVVLGLAVLAGCTLAPKYQRPAVAGCTNWPAGAGDPECRNPPPMPPPTSAGANFSATRACNSSSNWP